MKKLLFMFAAVATLFTACDKNEPEKVYDDHSADLVGTWTCLTDDFAEALVISADGSVVSTRLFLNEYSEDVKGKIVLENGNVTMTFEDGGNFKSHFDIIPGMAFSIFNEEGERLTFNYCKEDLSEEILGMWVCNDGLKDGVTIMSYSNNGKSTITTATALGTDDPLLNRESDYVVVGDLVFMELPTASAEGKSVYTAARMTYTPNATSAGDIMTHTKYAPIDNELKVSVMSFLRIKQYLELANNSYDYSNIYVTNVKAKDAEFEFAGQTLNLANMDGRILDKMMKTLLFNVSFPSANEIVYNYHYNGENIPMPAPIVVEGNKMTIKKSANNPAYKDIDVWTFQDQDNTQMHIYMPTYAFENFLANTIVEMMSSEGKLDLTNVDKVAEIYAAVAEAIETINVSFIFKTAK